MQFNLKMFVFFPFFSVQFKFLCIKHGTTLVQMVSKTKHVIQIECGNLDFRYSLLLPCTKLQANIAEQMFGKIGIFTLRRNY